METHSLTPEKTRILIGEACGWTDCNLGAAFGYPRGCSPKASFLGMTALPDYCNDLNAMHEAEEVLFKDEIHWRKYRHILDLYRYTNDTREPSAFQRATAFIATLGLADGTEGEK